MEFYLKLLAVAILVVAVPIALCYLIYLLIKKMKLDKRWRILAAIPVLVVGYLIFSAFFPNEDFYKANFKEVTKTDFPANGEIIYKTTSFPDHFGDYSSCFLVKLDKPDLKKLRNMLKVFKFERKENKLRTKELDNVEGEAGNPSYKETYVYQGGDRHYFVGFVMDGKSVVVLRASW